MRSTKSEQYWRSHVNSWRSSGLTQKQYGKKHGINPLTLAYWSHTLKRRDSHKPAQSLIPVRVVGEAVPMVIQVQHSAWRIAVPVGTDPRWLTSLLREMASC